MIGKLDVFLLAGGCGEWGGGVFLNLKFQASSHLL